MILYTLSLHDRLAKSRGSCIRKFTCCCNVMHCMPHKKKQLSRKPRDLNNLIFLDPKSLIRFGFVYVLDLGGSGKSFDGIYHMLVRYRQCYCFSACNIHEKFFNVLSLLAATCITKMMDDAAKHR